MRPLPFTWPIGLAFWIVWLWAAWPEVRVLRAARHAQRGLPRAVRDRSLRPLLAGQQLALAGSVIAALTLPAYTILRGRSVVYAAGVLLLALASALRRHCFRMLGADFQGAVTVRPDQPVVERGAYRHLRHPSYTAGILFHLAIALTMTHWVSIGIALVLAPLVFLHRIFTEERALASGLGAAYTSYMARTKRLIPWVW